MNVKPARLLRYSGAVINKIPPKGMDVKPAGLLRYAGAVINKIPPKGMNVKPARPLPPPGGRGQQKNKNTSRTSQTSGLCF